MDHLVKIEGLIAAATLYSQDWGAGKISGMVAYNSGGKWYLLTADYNNELYSIDPATGVGTFLCPLKNRYQGLAVDANGLVFGATGDGALWAIDLPARLTDPNAEWKVGEHGNGGIEALEFAFGIDEPRISPANLAGIGEPWVENGMLFTYGEGSGFLIVNPVTGEAIPYPCSLPSLDLEGIVFMPENADGWGQITVSACD